MASKREKLEKKAKKLGLDFVTATTDDELEQLIKDFDDSGDNGDTRYFKTSIPGLSLSLSESDDRSEVGVDEVRFEPYQLWNEKKGEHYKIGLLATDEPEVTELLEEDSNVVEIEKDEYDELVKAGKSVGY